MAGDCTIAQDVKVYDLEIESLYESRMVILPHTKVNTGFICLDVDLTVD